MFTIENIFENKMIGHNFDWRYGHKKVTLYNSRERILTNLPYSREKRVEDDTSEVNTIQRGELRKKKVKTMVSGNQ